MNDCFYGKKKLKYLNIKQLYFLTSVIVALTATVAQADDKPIDLLEDPLPYQGVGQIPDRPPLLVELGDPFLATGDLDKGFMWPTGSVWQPRFSGYLINRAVVQTRDNGIQSAQTEFVDRLDLYGNLQLSGTERVMVGIRPLDLNTPNRFTKWVIDSDTEEEGTQEYFNAQIRTLFFEGDLGSMFPLLDPQGFGPLDFGINVGRQNILLQDGSFINDDLDALGLVRNNIHLTDVMNLRVSLLWAWDQVDQGQLLEETNGDLYILSTAFDTYTTTWNIDAAWMNDQEDEPEDDGYYVALAATQRIGYWNTTFRVNASMTDEESTDVQDGILYIMELSRTPTGTHDVFYINLFAASDHYTMVGREPVVSGPLAPVGILFEGSGVGAYGSELDSFAKDAFGGAMGYQWIWDDYKQNLSLETAYKGDTQESQDDVAFGFQYQKRLNAHTLLQVDGFTAFSEDAKPQHGLRCEIQIIY